MEKRETVRERLKEYVRIGREFEEDGEKSDFDKFLIQHDDDVDITLYCIEEIERYMNGYSYDDFEDEKVYRELSYHFNNIKQIIKENID